MVVWLVNNVIITVFKNVNNTPQEQQREEEEKSLTKERGQCGQIWGQLGRRSPQSGYQPSSIKFMVLNQLFDAWKSMFLRYKVLLCLVQLNMVMSNLTIMTVKLENV